MEQDKNISRFNSFAGIKIEPPEEKEEKEEVKEEKHPEK